MARRKSASVSNLEPGIGTQMLSHSIRDGVMSAASARTTPARLIDAVVQHMRQGEGAESSIITGDAAGARDYISTQCLALDLALNMPGIPVGRLTVVRGWESSG